MVSNDLECANGTLSTGHEHIIIHCWSLSEGVLIFSNVFRYKKKNKCYSANIKEKSLTIINKVTSVCENYEICPLWV